MTRPRGFTTVELLVVIAVMAVIAATVSLPLATMQTSAGLTGAVDVVVDGLRRAQLQAASGYQGVSSWGIHLSDSATCTLPANQFYVYAGSVFSSASDTTDVVDLPDSAQVTALSLGGGCDVRFARFSGQTSNVGTVTITTPNGQPKDVSINSYGRVSR